MKSSNYTRPKNGRTARRGMGITGKLASAIVVSVLLAVAALLIVVYMQMSKELLVKSEEILEATMGETVQATKAWLNRNLTMLEVQRDTIEYQDMSASDIMRYVKYAAGQNESFPAGMYVALANGMIYHSSFVPGSDYDPLAKTWYKDGLRSENFMVGDVYLDEASNTYVVGVSGVLRDRNGQARGVAAADVSLESISRIVRNITVEDTGGLTVTLRYQGGPGGHPDRYDHWTPGQQHRRPEAESTQRRDVPLCQRADQGRENRPDRL